MRVRQLRLQFGNLLGCLLERLGIFRSEFACTFRALQASQRHLQIFESQLLVGRNHIGARLQGLDPPANLIRVDTQRGS